MHAVKAKHHKGYKMKQKQRLRTQVNHDAKVYMQRMWGQHSLASKRI